MSDRAKRWKKYLGATAGLAACVVMFSGFDGTQDTDVFLKISKGIDVFGRVYKEITANYVDEVDPEKFMQAGIDGMLSTLDPYTVYIDKEDGDEVDLLTNGKYGGIGVTIGVRDGAVRVVTVMDGYSAQRQGILPGDRFLEIDGQKVATKKPDDVRNLTRGEPGSEVRVKIEREGESKPLDFVLIREEIQVKNVTYSGFVDKGIAYIRLERFSRKAGDEVRQALKELKLQGDITGVILDLRGNPGGLLDAAVDVVSKFVPRNSMIVSTRGRRSENNREYISSEDPLIPTAPLVILTDRGSASASEIVTGALQDLDRGFVLGTRTFGKGLVQTILPLSYGAQLKITTARYYIPSGRSIQEIDYMHKDKNGVFGVYADSLKKEFHTANGRVVYEYGGIAPDSLVKSEETGPMVRELNRKSMFFKFAITWASKHKSDTTATVTPDMLQAFRQYLRDDKFDYQEESEAKVKDLRQLADVSHYSGEVLGELDVLSKSLAKEKEQGFERYKDHITDGLFIERMARLKGERGRIEASLKDDTQLHAAIAVIEHPKMYAAKLKGRKEK